MRLSSLLIIAAPLAALCVVCAGCSADRNVTSPSERFACATAADCASGFACLCGFCQPPGGTVQCLADATGSDAAGSTDTGGATDTGGVSVDVGVTDAGSKACNVMNWEGCKSVEGCYWNDTSKKSECLLHGPLGLNAPCDANKLNACGKDKSGEPLLCDMVDKRCYPLCNAQNPKNCAPGNTCYILQDQDKQDWPNNAGICAK